MRSRKLNAYACFALGNDRIIETGYEYAFTGHFSCEILRKFGVIKHNCADGRLGGFDVESGLEHAGAEILHVLSEPVMQFIAL